MSSEQELRAGAAALGVDLDDQQCERLLAYGGLILKWNKVYNLTALRDPASVLTHHLLDSLSIIAPLAREWPGRAALLDVGAGAGLPGVVIAIVRDDITVTSVMADPATATLARLADAAASGALQVPIGRTYPLDSVAEAVGAFGAGTVGKIAISVV